MALDVLYGILVLMVISGAFELIIGCYQFFLASLHPIKNPLKLKEDYMPRVSIIVPCWNEKEVLNRTLEYLTRLKYSKDHYRIYIIDDASTDGTGDLIKNWQKDNKNIHYIYKEKGGEGKAAVINLGLKEIMNSSFAEAVLVMDADVLFTPLSLLKMTRHLQRKEVGAVSAYIKEGSYPPNYLNKFVGFEYVTAQAAARRAQNVLGAQACLAGGSQLIKREALEEIGAEANTDTLAEDTVTTFSIQLNGWRVVFEPHAIVWAEEPDSLTGLWKQRLRWARGNVQVTKRFKGVWLKREKNHNLGNLSFAMIWFSVILMPVFMIIATIGLVTLWIIERQLSIDAFEWLWFLTGFTYLFVTISAFSFDKNVAKISWFQGILFPGFINLFLILFGLLGPIVADGLNNLLVAVNLPPNETGGAIVLLLANLWLSLSMVCAYLLKRLESTPLKPLVRPLFYFVGYGPLLCAITFSAYYAEFRRREMIWEKTEKKGRVRGARGGSTDE